VVPAAVLEVFCATSPTAGAAGTLPFPVIPNLASPLLLTNPDFVYVRAIRRTGDYRLLADIGTLLPRGSGILPKT
jgi:hypothetical protein